MNASTDSQSAAWQAYLAQDASGFPFKVSIVALTLGTVMYALRLLARRHQNSPYGWDDWFMVAAYVCLVGNGITGILCVQYGTGRHIEYVLTTQPPSTITNWGITNLYITVMFWLPGITLPKMSLLVLYLRIFTDRFSRWCCWITMAAIVARVVVDVFTISFQCGLHPEYAWQPAYWRGNCDNITAHYTWARLCNIASDVVCMILPLPAIWRLKLSLHVKLGIAATFLIGGGGLIAAILSMLAFLSDNIIGDSTWAAADLVGWALIEQITYFISVCLVSCRPLLTPVVRLVGGISTISKRPSRLSYGKQRSKDHSWNRHHSGSTPPKAGVFTEIKGGASVEMLPRLDIEYGPSEIAKDVHTSQMSEYILPARPADVLPIQRFDGQSTLILGVEEPG